MAIIYYLTGPDGCGKTAFVKELEVYFTEEGLTTNHIWLRSPKIISKPLMAYCRLVGLTKYETIGGIRYGWHEFNRSWLVSLIFPWLQLIDLKIKKLFLSKVFRSNSVILIDRFSLDTLADLMVDTEKFALHKTNVGKLFLNTIPEGTNIIALSTREEIIRSRKLDTLHDPVLFKKIKAYNILSNDLNLEVVDNNRDFEKVKNEIMELLALKNERTL